MCPSLISNSVFREYDIRGIIGKELPLENIQDLTRAILTYFLSKQPDLSHIVVGMDGRIHSDSFKKEVITAALEMGINVVDLGLCPTPVFYFSLFNSEADSGLMITASHNPKEYNGIKICLEGKSVWGKEIQKIKQILQSGRFTKKNTPGKTYSYDVITDYIAWMKNHFSHLQGIQVNTIIDCGNGTAGTVFPKLINALDLKNVSLLYEEVDGEFPNHEPDPTTLKNMSAVKSILETNSSFSFGLGLDGDCDRMNPLTKAGYLVPGDQLLALYTKKIIKDFPHPTIVFDIKSSLGLIEALKSYGAIPHMAPSGHSIIKEHLRISNAKLAGEISCHFFFNDRYFGYDDGIYAALRLFELLHETQLNLDALIDTLPKKVSSPEYRISCAESDKTLIVDHVRKVFEKHKDVEIITIDGVRATFADGWGLIRASNTQSVVCLRFESDSRSGLRRVESMFKNALLPFFSNRQLTEKFGEH
jgi:phosphomannomutase / phosphoglucomutase